MDPLQLPVPVNQFVFQPALPGSPDGVLDQIVMTLGYIATPVIPMGLSDEKIQEMARETMTIPIVGAGRFVLSTNDFRLLSRQIAAFVEQLDAEDD